MKLTNTLGSCSKAMRSKSPEEPFHQEDGILGQPVVEKKHVEISCEVC